MPRALAQQDDRTVLILDDPGGDLLSRHVGRSWSIGDLLRVAIGLAASLRKLHERGIVHRDIKPSNLMVDIASGEVWLTGVGLASRAPRERQPPRPPEAITGTLAYMAPEQTGRMNRSTDARSDLYSIGITLFELAMGTLPFAATTPMEWIHCHIARRPSPMDETVPAPLAAIVAKLLAKTADDRYQTAAGLEADLRRCRVGMGRAGE